MEDARCSVCGCVDDDLLCEVCHACKDCCEGTHQTCAICAEQETAGLQPCLLCDRCCMDHGHDHALVLLTERSGILCGSCKTIDDGPATSLVGPQVEEVQCARCGRRHYAKAGWITPVTSAEAKSSLLDISKSIRRAMKLGTKPELPDDFVERVRKPSRDPKGL